MYSKWANSPNWGAQLSKASIQPDLKVTSPDTKAAFPVVSTSLMTPAASWAFA
jgi:hypothetical protein